MAPGARHRWRSTLALVVSLFVHAALLWSFRRDAPTTSRESAPLELTEITWLDNASPAPAGGSNTSAPKRRQTKTPLAPKRTEAPPASSDAPTRVDLSVGDVPVVIAQPRGTTLYPTDLPSEAELRADTEARVQVRVEGWLKSDLAQARAAKGLSDPAYGVLGAALRDATDDVPSLINTNDPGAVSKAFATAWLSGAERYGKTGAPYDEPEGRLEFIERPSALEAAAQNGSVQARQLQQFLYAGARLQEFADGRTGLELYALVEVHQRDSGEVASVQLLRPSGLAGFDAWVLKRSNGVQLALTWDAGARRKPLRSVWRFDAIMKFRRKLKLKELNGRAVVGMIALSVLSGLSAMGDGAPRLPAAAGRFDETTGELDVVDLTNPTYDCTVKLVEAD